MILGIPASTVRLLTNPMMIIKIHFVYWATQFEIDKERFLNDFGVRVEGLKQLTGLVGRTASFTVIHT